MAVANTNEEDVVAVPLCDAFRPRLELAACPFEAVVRVSTLSRPQIVERVVIPVWRRNEYDPRPVAMEDRALHPGQLVGLDMLDGLKKHRRIEAHEGRVRIREGPSHQLHAAISPAQRSAQSLPGAEKRRSAAVQRNDSLKPIFVKELGKQFALAATEVEHASGLHLPQAVKDGAYALLVQFRGH
jgi:hypothetical protein